MSPKKLKSIYKSVYFWIFLAFVIRIAVSLLPVVPISDCEWYNEVAINMHTGKGFSFDETLTAYRMPAYPFILSKIYDLSGINPLCGRIFNALLGTLAVILGYKFIQKRLGKQKALIGAIAIALFPEHILFTNALCPEILFASLLILWLLLTELNGYWKILSGLLAAAMVYIKPVAIPIVLLPLLWDLKRWKIWLASIIIVILSIIPWVARNYKHFDHYSLTDNFWVNIWIGNGAMADGGYFDPTDPPKKSEFALEDYYRDRFIKDLKRDPLRPFVLIPVKLAHYAIPSLTAAYWGLAGIFSNSTRKVIAAILTILNIALVIAFILKVFQKKVPAKILWIILYFSTVPIVFFGNDRFRFPIILFILLSVITNLKSREER